MSEIIDIVTMESLSHLSQVNTFKPCEVQTHAQYVLYLFSVFCNLHRDLYEQLQKLLNMHVYKWIVSSQNKAAQDGVAESQICKMRGTLPRREWEK